MEMRTNKRATQQVEVLSDMQKQAAAQGWTVGDAAVGHILQCSLDAVALMNAGDAQAPGLVLSKLPNGQYYASVTRYPKWNGEKVVVYKAAADSPHEALKGAMGQFLQAQAVFDRLRAAVGGR